MNEIIKKDSSAISMMFLLCLFPFGVVLFPTARPRDGDCWLLWYSFKSINFLLYTYTSFYAPSYQKKTIWENIQYLSSNFINNK